MPPEFDDLNTSNPDLLPIEWSREVIKEAATQSAVLGLSRRRTMSTRQARMPATAALAGAYWVGSGNNDFTNLKRSTRAEWQGVNLIVEELAALIAIPDAYEQDNSFPVWDEARPQVVEAMGAAIDAAVIFGVNKPTTWQSALLPSIVAANQTVAEGGGADLAVDIAESARVLKTRGFNTNGFAVEPGFNWRLVGLRSQDGTPIYQTNLSGPLSQGLYGFPMGEVDNGAWEAADPGDTPLVIHGDWRKSIVGVRQDITMTRHPSGVINDEDGLVLFNAMQQDSTIWRVVFRVAWARANPATRLGPDKDRSGDLYPNDPDAPSKFPFAALVPAAS